MYTWKAGKTPWHRHSLISVLQSIHSGFITVSKTIRPHCLYHYWDHIYSWLISRFINYYDNYQLFETYTFVDAVVKSNDCLFIKTDFSFWYFKKSLKWKVGSDLAASYSLSPTSSIPPSEKVLITFYKSIFKHTTKIIPIISFFFLIQILL